MTIDSARDMSLWPTMRIAARTWRRTPALAIVIVCTLALGIGATTSAFTIAYSILVQQFPFPDADRLVWITTYDIMGSVRAEPMSKSMAMNRPPGADPRYGGARPRPDRRHETAARLPSTYCRGDPSSAIGIL